MIFLLFFANNYFDVLLLLLGIEVPEKKVLIEEHLCQRKQYEICRIVMAFLDVWHLPITGVANLFSSSANFSQVQFISATQTKG